MSQNNQVYLLLHVFIRLPAAPYNRLIPASTPCETDIDSIVRGKAGTISIGLAPNTSPV